MQKHSLGWPANLRRAARAAQVCVAALLLTPSAAFANPAAHQADIITLFTHGETVLMNNTASGKFEGPAMTLFTCAMDKMGRPFRIIQAPLSRARTILNEFDDAVWFPSAFRGDTERLSRTAGPAGALGIYWYMLKSNAQDPESNAFKASAKVTAFKGSALVDRLHKDGYNFTEGSADKNRLVYLLLSKQIDALLAVDFRKQLTNDTRLKLASNIKMTLRESIPVSFQIAKPFAKKDPSFVEKMRAAIKGCNSN